MFNKNKKKSKKSKLSSNSFSVIKDNKQPSVTPTQSQNEFNLENSGESKSQGLVRKQRPSSMALSNPSQREATKVSIQESKMPWRNRVEMPFEGHRAHWMKSQSPLDLNSNSTVENKTDNILTNDCHETESKLHNTKNVQLRPIIASSSQFRRTHSCYIPHIPGSTNRLLSRIDSTVAFDQAEHHPIQPQFSKQITAAQNLASLEHKHRLTEFNSDTTLLSEDAMCLTNIDKNCSKGYSESPITCHTNEKLHDQQCSNYTKSGTQYCSEQLQLYQVSETIGDGVILNVRNTSLNPKTSAQSRFDSSSVNQLQDPQVGVIMGNTQERSLHHKGSNLSLNNIKRPTTTNSPKKRYSASFFDQDTSHRQNDPIFQNESESHERFNNHQRTHTLDVIEEQNHDKESNVEDTLTKTSKISKRFSLTKKPSDVGQGLKVKFSPWNFFNASLRRTNTERYQASTSEKSSSNSPKTSKKERKLFERSSTFTSKSRSTSEGNFVPTKITSCIVESPMISPKNDLSVKEDNPSNSKLSSSEATNERRQSSKTSMISLNESKADLPLTTNAASSSADLSFTECAPQLVAFNKSRLSFAQSLTALNTSISITRCESSSKRYSVEGLPAENSKSLTSLLKTDKKRLSNDSQIISSLVTHADHYNQSPSHNPTLSSSLTTLNLEENRLMLPSDTNNNKSSTISSNSVNRNSIETTPSGLYYKAPKHLLVSETYAKRRSCGIQDRAMGNLETALASASSDYEQEKQRSVSMYSTPTSDLKNENNSYEISEPNNPDQAPSQSLVNDTAFHNSSSDNEFSFCEIPRPHSNSVSDFRCNPPSIVEISMESASSPIQDTRQSALDFCDYGSPGLSNSSHPQSNKNSNESLGQSGSEIRELSHRPEPPTLRPKPSRDVITQKRLSSINTSSVALRPSSSMLKRQRPVSSIPRLESSSLNGEISKSQTNDEAAEAPVRRSCFIKREIDWAFVAESAYARGKRKPHDASSSTCLNKKIDMELTKLTEQLRQVLILGGKGTQLKCGDDGHDQASPTSPSNSPLSDANFVLSECWWWVLPSARDAHVFVNSALGAPSLALLMEGQQLTDVHDESSLLSLISEDPKLLRERLLIKLKERMSLMKDTIQLTQKDSTTCQEDINKLRTTIESNCPTNSLCVTKFDRVIHNMTTVLKLICQLSRRLASLEVRIKLSQSTLDMFPGGSPACSTGQFSVRYSMEIPVLIDKRKKLSEQLQEARKIFSSQRMSQIALIEMIEENLIIDHPTQDPDKPTFDIVGPLAMLFNILIYLQIAEADYKDYAEILEHLEKMSL